MPFFLVYIHIYCTKLGGPQISSANLRIKKICYINGTFRNVVICGSANTSFFPLKTSASNSPVQICITILGGFAMKGAERGPTFRKDVFHPLYPLEKQLWICD